MNTATPILWQFTISHFAEKARWALDYKRVPHVRRSLFPGPHVARIKKMTGQSAVPVLEMDGNIIFDSSRVMQALDEAHPEPPLYPSDPAEREHALQLEDFFDEHLGVDLRQWGYFMLLRHTSVVTAMFSAAATRPQRLFLRVTFPAVRPVMRRMMKINSANAAAARERTLAAMDRIARELQPSGYLVGDSFSAADLTAAALLSPLVMPAQAPYPYPRSLPKDFLHAREQLSSHRAFKWVESIYARHRGSSSAIAEETVI